MLYDLAFGVSEEKRLNDIVICSGGTGGHMFPACALFQALKQNNYNVSLVTDKRGNVFCGNISDADKILLETVRFSAKSCIPAIFKLFFVFIKLIRAWRKKRPSVAIGFGNLCTVVPMITAKLFGAKLIVYEQNSVIGKANALLSKIADLKLSAFPVGEDWLLFSSPAREEFIKYRHVPYFCDHKIKILIIGGSQGAKSFNKIIPLAVSSLNESQRENIEIIQQVEYESLEPLSDYYHHLGIKSSLVKFIYNVAEIMADAQLVICRSGASTLTELSVIGRPAILIPYPKAAKNHQYLNALYYKSKKAAWILEEKENFEDTAKELSCLLKNILENRELLKSAASNMINVSAVHAIDDFIKLVNVCLKKGG